MAERSAFDTPTKVSVLQHWLYSVIFEIISETIPEGRTEVQRRWSDHQREGRLWKEERGTTCDRRNSSTKKYMSQSLLKMMTYVERNIKIIVTTVFKIVHGKLLKKKKTTKNQKSMCFWKSWKKPQHPELKIQHNSELKWHRRDKLYGLYLSEFKPALAEVQYLI